MKTRNAGWYNLNEQRCWPLSDAATQIDDSGQRLHSDIIADLNVRFPKTTASAAYISAITVSRSLLTVIVSAVNEARTPLLSISVLRPIDPGVQQVMQSEDGFSFGRIVFGHRMRQIELPEHTLAYRFSTPTQSVLAARAARPFRMPEVTSISVSGDNRQLTGRVRLLGGADIETKGELRVIEGRRKLVGVLRLKDKSESTASQINLSETYAGDCGRRPESKNCRDGIPIESINEVTPDCCGRIFIEFRGGAEPFEITNDNLNGVALDYPFNLVDACVTPARLPDSRGRLPNEYPDLCAPVSQPLVSASAVAEPVSFNALRTWDSDDLLDMFGLRVDQGEWKTEYGEVPYSQSQFGEIAQVFNVAGRLGLISTAPHGLAENDALLLPYPTWSSGCVLRVLDQHSVITSFPIGSGKPAGWLRPTADLDFVTTISENATLAISGEHVVGETLTILGHESHEVQVEEVLNSILLRLSRPATDGLACRNARPIKAIGQKHVLVDSAETPDSLLLIGLTDVQAIGVSGAAQGRLETSGRPRDGLRLWLPTSRSELPLARSTDGSGLHRLLRPQPADDYHLVVSYRMRQAAGRRFNFSAVCDYASSEDYMMVTADFEGRRALRVFRVDRGKKLLQGSVPLPREVAVTSELQLELSIAHAADGGRFLSAALFAPGTGDLVAVAPVALRKAQAAMVGVQSKNGSVAVHRFTLSEVS